METWLQLAITSLVTLGASSGFWAYLQHKDRTRTATIRLLMGIAYEHIMTFGVAYLRRGWATRDEYEELRKYFYEPYKALGGNGAAERVMKDVEKLSFFPPRQEYETVVQSREPREINDVRVVARQTSDPNAE